MLKCHAVTLGGSVMSALRIIISILLGIDCVALIVVVLMQQGKGQGLGALAGGNGDSYWERNKNRSAEGNLKKITRILTVIFFALAVILNIPF